jgi:hypothetical protein
LRATIRGGNSHLALTEQIEKAPLVVGQRVRKSGCLDRRAAKFKGAMREEYEVMSRKCRSLESEFQARGTGLWLMWALLVPDGLRKSSTFFSNIFVRKNCGQGWVHSRVCACLQGVLLERWLVAKKRLYNRCAREWSGGLSSAARSEQMG